MTSPVPDGPRTPDAGFASDNCAGAHPEILAALTAANEGYQGAYGDDAYTARLRDVVRRHFGDQAEAFCVFNGTGANVVALQSMSERWSSVICAEGSHINVDECGAAEKVAGLKLVPVPAPDGRLTPELVDRYAWGWGDVHHAQPGVVSLTQSTELGTVYTPEQIAALTAHAHERGMRVHMDGARLANAAASLGVPLRALTTDAGVDVLSFGGTKNGLLMGEAVVVLDPAAVRGLPFLRKAGMQLASKMRFISAQLVALLDGDLWLRNARHANAMARRLAEAVRPLPGVRITRPVEANAVFAALSAEAAARLREQYSFATWDERTGEVRWMCSFATTEDEVRAFTSALAKALTP
ncbi:threonine aldolase [Actinomadura sp. NBRC 104425]|uniref:threonine aldolase family protein n=1 Tax=Actinomadura sp. NBRC 104425 TaxID=3032204 RepID=UPI0024A48D5F|nr:low specificity L-threonine aldolase [Actinomadura sp. NBRC 104425]GLZ10781.1 threonine aldolase [Actinomadura sp. NBRC 104425]